MTTSNNLSFRPLTIDEMKEAEGGFLPYVLGAISIVGAIYGAGYAVGTAYYYYTH